MATTVTVVVAPPVQRTLNLNSVLAGLPIFISGGMSLALGLGWNLRTHIPTTPHFQYSWFIGAIVGALLAAPLIPVMRKRLHLLASAALVIVGGIIFVSAPYNYEAIVAARYINGLGVGLATVPFLVLNGEVGTRLSRGTLLSYEQFGITLGIAVQVVYAAQWTYGTAFSANRLHGILAILCGLVALGGALLTIESPIYHVRRGDDTAALECLRRLHWEPAITGRTRAYLAQHKAYVVKNEHSPVLGGLGASALLRMLCFRALVALSFSLPLSSAMQVSGFVAFNSLEDVVPVCAVLLRLLCALVAAFLMRFSRKRAPLLSLVVMGALLIAVGVIFRTGSNILNVHEMTVAGILAGVQQAIAGLYVPSASAYLGEAFPLLAKPYCIAACVAVEQLVHIIVICTYTINSFEQTYVYCVSSGAIMLAFFLVFCATLPETRLTTRQEAQDLFRRWLHLGFRNGRTS